MVFTDEEIKCFWDNLDEELVDMFLVQCYSGWRPSEICELKIENVDLENGFFTGGMKTEAGKDRIVPIHSKILPLVRKRYEKAIQMKCEYLFWHVVGYKTKKVTYEFYKKRFDVFKMTFGLNPEHNPHDCRKHFVTQAKKYKLDEYAIKYIVGHVIDDLTENTYTERDPQWLKSEIEKIK